MSYQVFARKYRPRTFVDVLGQDHVVRTLKNAIEQNRLAHAYLFVGPRGTGKTSTARIFAKALNCPGGPKAEFDPDDPVCMEIAEGRSLDVLEIDGASNNGVEQVRDLRDNVQFAPASGQFKIFYIDEVHMLSKQAFNALLKTLEEPPPHVKFIFATTEAHKILPTILSRCQRFDLRPISTETIAQHLLYIASEEGVNLTPEAAYAVAKAADGGMRDAQSMLDQLVSFCGTSIEESHVLDIFGITSRETVGQVIAYMLSRQLSPLLAKINEQSESGRDLMQFLAEMIFALREVLISKVDPNTHLEGVSPELLASIEAVSSQLNTAKLLRVVEILAETEERMKWATNKRLHMEIGMIKAVHSLSEINISDIIRALDGAPLIDIKETPPAVIPVPLPATPTEEAPSATTPATIPAVVEEEPPSAPAPAPPLPQENATEEKAPEAHTPSVVREEPVNYSAKEEDSTSPAKTSPEPAPSPAPPREESSGIDDDFLSDISGSSPGIPTPSARTSRAEAPTYENQPSIPEAQDSSSPTPTEAPESSPAETPVTPPPFIDNSPVRPMETEEDNEDDDSERPVPIDKNTVALFPGLDDNEEEIREAYIADASVWQTALTYIEENFPIKFLSVRHTIFAGHEGNQFIVGVNPNDLMARDVLLNSEFREKIEQFLLNNTGARLSFTVRSTEDAPMPVEEELEPIDLSQPPPPSPKIQEPKLSPEELKKREQMAAAEREAAKAAAMEEFYNDPLIQDAMEIFQAKISK